MYWAGLAAVRSACAVRVGPLPHDQAPMPAQHGAGYHQAVHPQRLRQEADERGEQRAVRPVRRGCGRVRRSTAISCRSTSSTSSTSSSMSLDAVERPSRTSKLQSRTKVR
jgi:hypothetical protein